MTEKKELNGTQEDIEYSMLNLKTNFDNIILIHTKSLNIIDLQK